MQRYRSIDRSSCDWCCNSEGDLSWLELMEQPAGELNEFPIKNPPTSCISQSERSNQIDRSMAMAMGMGSNNYPCAACKFLRRKCLAGCIFAPYFPPEEPHKFANVHKIFGASNVAKLLNELLPQQREDAVKSLAYEAEARVKDPVYGCVGAISVLQRQVQRLQKELDAANADLLRYACNDHIVRMELPLIPPPPAINYQRISSIAHHARTNNNTAIGRRRNSNNHGADGSEAAAAAAAAAAAGGGGPLYDHHQAPTSSSFMAVPPSPPPSTNMFWGYYRSINTIPVEDASADHIKGRKSS